LEASRLSVVGNLLEDGPDTPPETPLFFNHGTSPLELFLSDNLAFTTTGASGTGVWRQTPSVARSQTSSWPDEFEALPAGGEGESRGGRTSGSAPWERDGIDRRIIEAALQGKGKIIDSEAEVAVAPPPFPPGPRFVRRIGAIWRRWKRG